MSSASRWSALGTGWVPNEEHLSLCWLPGAALSLPGSVSMAIVNGELGRRCWLHVYLPVLALTRNARVVVYSLFKAVTAQNSKHSKSLRRAL